MKKLMTVFASAAALCALNAAKAGTPTTTGFETAAYVAGQALDTTKDDEGNTAGPTYGATWCPTNTEDTAIVTAYDSDTMFAATNVSGFTSTDLLNNYLKLDGAPLITRYAQAGAQALDIGEGLYIDTLVQFSATDPESVPTTSDGDKLCIWLADNENDQDHCTLMIGAGYINNDDGYDIVPTNYVTTATFANNSWHRLQVKVLTGIDSTDMLGDGFVVFIDGTAVATTTCPINSEYISEYELNQRAARYMTAGSYKLFPSLINKDTSSGTITALSFSGTGAIDNLEFSQGADIDPILIAAADMPHENTPENLVFNGEDSVIGAVGNLTGTAYEFDGAEEFTGLEGGESFPVQRTTVCSLLPGYAWTDGTFAPTSITFTVTYGGDTPSDWPTDPSSVTGKTAEEAFGITGDLASADAVQLATWAKGTGSVNFADKGNISADCFLLNIANGSTAQEIQDEKDEFVMNITFDSEGNPQITAPVGKEYNGTLVIYGSDSLTTPKANWDVKTAGDKFFYGKLVP